MNKKLPTQYAPAERASSEEIRAQNLAFQGNTLVDQFINATPDLLLVLNADRQMVFASQSTYQFANIETSEDALGLRPGELFGCAHAFESNGGCGTTEFCRMCGAVNAILAAQQGSANTQECRISLRNGVDALDLRVNAAPIQVQGQNFTLFAVTDISNEKRRRALERIFFHDILNTAGGLQGFAALLKDATPIEVEEYKEAIYDISQTLVEAIQSQKELVSAENGELVVHPEVFDPYELAQEVIAIYKYHEVAAGRQLTITEGQPGQQMSSDKTLLKRVLGNLVKNALEASKPQDQIAIGFRINGQSIEFHVHNPGFIPRSVQLQLFQRSFSTKGAGRGLGTYSVRLLTHRYLHGSINWQTSELEGTTFLANYPLHLE